MVESTKNQNQKGKGQSQKKPGKKTKGKWWNRWKLKSEINHKSFVFEYLKNGQVWYAAYMKIYPWVSQRTAEVNASKLLSDTKIISMIDEQVQKSFKLNEIDVDYIIGWLKEVAEKCLQRRRVRHVEIKVTKKKNKEEKEVVETLVTWWFNPKEANNAFDKLGKYKKLWSDKDNDKDKPIINNVHVHLPDNWRWQTETT